MVRECRPLAREPARSWLARRSTMTTSTPANANSPANISPVGPPPAITTACSVIATLRPHAFRDSHFRRLWQAGDAAAPPGPYRKPPVRYILRVPRSGSHGRDRPPPPAAFIL